MTYRIAGLWTLSLPALGLGLALAAITPAPAHADDCSQGSTEEQVACLNQKVAKLEELVKDSLKWNDRIALINEDMRIFPRCLENPGPNTRQLNDVYASSCAKTPSQAWMIRKAYSVGK